MTDRQPATHAGHKDHLIGICARIGEDFGFNPDIPRVMLAIGLLFAPAIVLAVYFGMGGFVLASRLLFPPPRARADEAPAPAAHEPATTAEPAAPEAERMLQAA